jgi:AcrR family transcriptional regulator
LAPATFYKHFRNKTEVFAAAFERLAVAEAQQLGRCLLVLSASGDRS